MKNFFFKKTIYSRTNSFFIKVLSVSLTLLFVFFLTACKPSIRYFDYVSELRNNVFFAQTETYSLRIYSASKEYPYETDGIKKETTTRTEIYFLPSSGDKTCHISFTINEQSYGGEMSYDNVKAEYYFSCSLDSSALKNIDCFITYGEEEIELNALSVVKPSMLTAQNALQSLIKEESSLFSSLTDKYGFAGEIYIRLIYEDSPYYYIGVIDRSGTIHAFLLNAESGKILAKRQS